MLGVPGGAAGLPRQAGDGGEDVFEAVAHGAGLAGLAEHHILAVLARHHEGRADAVGVGGREPGGAVFVLAAIPVRDPRAGHQRVDHFDDGVEFLIGQAGGGVRKRLREAGHFGPL